MGDRNREYSSQHIADIHFVYGFCNGNATAARREYQRRFPNRPVPNVRTFASVHARLAERGIRRQPIDLPRVIPAHHEQAVLEMIYRDPRLSTRLIALRLGLSRWTVWRILKREGLHPYHFRRVQNIIEPDYAARSVFCSWIITRTRQNPDFLKKILWTDEAKFTRSGITNFRNLHLWMAENPHAVRPSSFQHEFSVNVWAGIIDDQLIGPIVLPASLTGPRFLNFLQTDFFEAMLELPIEYRQNMWMQLDGAPAHFSLDVRAHLNEIFPGRWIGRGGPVAWPPRSPDLTPLDFFFWGWMKQQVYFEPVNTREDLEARIRTAAESIRRDPNMLRRSTQQVAIRSVAGLQSRGGYFEQLTNSRLSGGSAQSEQLPSEKKKKKSLFGKLKKLTKSRSIDDQADPEVVEFRPIGTVSQGSDSDMSAAGSRRDLRGRLSDMFSRKGPSRANSKEKSPEKQSGSTSSVGSTRPILRNTSTATLNTSTAKLNEKGLLMTPATKRKGK